MASSAIIITAFTVVGMLLLIAGVTLCFLSNPYAVAAAYTGMLAVGLTAVHSSATSLIFWGVAAVIVLVIQYLLPRNVARSRLGIGYIAGAALAGAFVGMVMSHGWMIVGAAVGAILGGIAFSRTPDGAGMEFPSSKFLNYLCAKGLPAVVVMSIAGTTVLWLVSLID